MACSHDLNVKLLDILVNLVHEQNAQFLQIIAEGENINFKDIMTLLPSNYTLKIMLSEFTQARRLEKSNSTSESSVSFSSPEEE
jgi:hypothetical protein